MPIGYDSPRKLIALAGVGLVIFGFLNLNVIFIGIGAAVLGYFTFVEK